MIFVSGHWPKLPYTLSRIIEGCVPTLTALLGGVGIEKSLPLTSLVLDSDTL